MANIMNIAAETEHGNEMPVEAFLEMQSTFALMDELYPVFRNLRFETVIGFITAFLHTWCDDHHYDIRETLQMMHDAAVEVVKEEAIAQRKEIF